MSSRRKVTLECNPNEQQLFDIVEVNQKNGNPITVLKPKVEVKAHRQYLDGFSYYSFMLNELSNYLIQNDRSKLVLDMFNVSYLADCGDGLLLGIKRECLKKNGDLQCINVSNEIKKVGASMEWPMFFGFYDSIEEAKHYFENFYPSRVAKALKLD